MQSKEEKMHVYIWKVTSKLFFDQGSCVDVALVQWLEHLVVAEETQVQILDALIINP